MRMTGRAARGHNRRMADDDARILALPQAPEAVELRHLRAFVAVAEELNFGRAAERLYVSQPALSRQIRALERGLGCELLRRSTHRVELTLAGEALLDRARRVLADVDEAVSATQAVGGELTNRVARMFAPLAEVAAADADLEAMRAAYEELCARFEPPPEVATRSVIAGGVPALLLEPAGGAPATLLHLHGGGFTMGSAFGSRPLVGALAAAAGTGAIVPDYRLASGASVPRRARGRRARLPVDARPRDRAGADRRVGRLGRVRARLLAAAHAARPGAAAAGRVGPPLPLGRPRRRHPARQAGARVRARLRRRPPARRPAAVAARTPT